MTSLIKVIFDNNEEKYIPIERAELIYGIEIHQVVAPYFLGTGDEKVKEGVETQKRHSVIAIIKHNSDEKYLCVDCKNRVCKSFVLGGVEEGETTEEAAIREVKEETGYCDVIIEYKSPISLINHFYASYKDINRYAFLDIVIGKLNSEKNIGISEKESQKHKVEWISKEKLKDFITVNNNIYALNILLNGDSAYTGNGVMVNSHELNGISSVEARVLVENKFCCKD